MSNSSSSAPPGWNDPPQFTYSSLASSGVKKSKLLKRPSPSHYHQAHSSHPHTSPLPNNTTHTPQPISNARQPQTNILAPPTSKDENETLNNSIQTEGEGLMKVWRDGEEEEEEVRCEVGEEVRGEVGEEVRGEVGEEEEVKCSSVINGLMEVFETVQGNMKGREGEDVRRRVEVMGKQWTEGSLSQSVQQEMTTLVTALKNGDTDTAHKIHIALMVDHTSEVSQWMVGVKRLIAAAKKMHS